MVGSHPRDSNKSGPQASNTLNPRLSMGAGGKDDYNRAWRDCLS